MPDVPSSARQPKQLWRRVYPSTWCVLLVALAVLALVEIPGRRTGKMTYAHGWPLAYLERDCTIDVILAMQSQAGPFDGPQDYSRNGLSWADESLMTPWSWADPSARSDGHGAADAAICLAVLAGIGWGFQRWRSRRERSPFRFRLRTMLAAFAILGLVFSRLAAWHAEIIREPQIVAELAAKTPGGNSISRGWMAPTWLPESLAKIGDCGALFNRVSSIRLSAGDYTDQEADDLAALPYLSSLELQTSAITAADLKQLRRLKHLRRLLLNGLVSADAGGEEIRLVNQFQELEELELYLDSAPCVHLEGFPALKRLTVKRLSLGEAQGGRKPGEPAVQLGDLPALERLTISHYSPLQFGEMPKLIDLDLDQSKLTDAQVDRIEAMPGLNSLELKQIEFDRPQTLEFIGHAELRGLGIASDNVEAIHLENLVNLKKAELGAASLHLVRLRELPKLSHLAIGSNSLVEADFHGLDSLVEMGISNPLPHYGPAGHLLMRGWSELSAVQSLDVSNTQLDDAALTEIGRLPTLHSLKLAETWLDDRQLKLLGSLPELSDLDLAATDVTDAAVADLRRMPKLASVDLSKTTISDAAIAELQRAAPQLAIKWATKKPALAAFRRQIAAVRAGQSTEISLQVLNRTGEQLGDADLAELAGLANLETLNLWGAHLTDAGLKQLAKIPHLKTLKLSNTHVTDAGLPYLAALDELRSLSLSWTAIRGAGLAKLKQLRQLDLSISGLNDAGAAGFDRLTNLEELNLSDSEISDAGIAHLANLPALRSLNLSSVKVTDSGLAAIRTIPRLESLDLTGNKLSDAGMKNLVGSPHITELRLVNDAAVGDEGFAAIAQLGELTKLDLQGTRISAAGLKNLTRLARLHDLDLSGTSVNDDGIRCLARLGELNSLTLSRTAVTGVGLTGLTQLRRVNLSESPFDDAGVAAIASLSALEDLDLSGRQEGKLNLAPLAKLTKLRVLALGYLELQDAALQPLKELQQLESLDLSNNEITDAGLKNLSGLKQLRTLKLASNSEIGDGGMLCLTGLENLTDLDLAQTKITDAAVDRLKLLPALESLNLDHTGITDSGEAALKSGLPKLKSISRDINGASVF